MKLWMLLTFAVGIVSTLAKTSDKTLSVGGKAIDFELDSIGGQKVKPVDSKMTTVLIFSRAHWCPFCLKQLLELRRNAEKLKAANARVVVVFREEAKGIDKEYSTYIIDKSGRISGFIKGDTKNRAKSQRILDTIAGLQSGFTKVLKTPAKSSVSGVFGVKSLLSSIIGQGKATRSSGKKTYDSPTSS